MIVVTIGDIKGIGIEILINLWVQKKINNFVLVTNYKIFQDYLKKEKIKIPTKKINENIKFFRKYFLVYDIKTKNNITNTYDSLIKSYELIKKEKLKGLITLPLNKEKMKKIDNKFIGHTEFFQKLDKKKNVNMLFIYKNTFITTLTTHIELKYVNKYLSDKKNIFNKINLLNNVLKKSFNIKKPKLIWSGINPHAGENNTIGIEETKYILPIINKLKKNKVDIIGPISGDAMVTDINIRKYDCFIFNYHDQALIPFKIISKREGLNYTSGLSFIRISPDHGTAYDIVGKKIAKNQSILNCFNFFKKL